MCLLKFEFCNVLNIATWTVQLQQVKGKGAIVHVLCFFKKKKKKKVDVYIVHRSTLCIGTFFIDLRGF